MSQDADILAQVDEQLDALSSPTSVEVLETLAEFDQRYQVASVGRVAKTGGGGSQPGAVRLLDLGVIEPADLLAGPVTLYTPGAGEICGPVILGDVTLLDNPWIVVARDEMVLADPDFPPLAAVGNQVIYDGYGFISQGSDRFWVPVTTGPVTVGLSSDQLTPPVSAWEAETEYAEAAGVIGLVTDVGPTFWTANAPGGVSGLSEPDWTASWPGDEITDGTVVWHPQVPLPTTGSVHLYVYSTVPVAP